METKYPVYASRETKNKHEQHSRQVQVEAKEELFLKVVWFEKNGIFEFILSAKQTATLSEERQFRNDRILTQLVTVFSCR
jgi:hypothetical protein